MSKGHKIVTEYVYPPIPDRSMDWSAVFSDYDGADDSRSLIGRGPTEVSAIADLLQQQEEREPSELVQTLIEIGTAPWCSCYGLPHAEDCKIFVGVTKAGERIKHGT